MAASAAEFVRGLRAAFAAAEIADSSSGEQLRYRVAYAGAACEVEAVAGPGRTIAGLSLPTLLVRLRFSDGDAAQRAVLLNRLDLHQQRGGG